ncbi:MAG: glutamine synthetase [Gammaproteobacteria bacterium]|nr:glutamine synthetase [Gammaproteobacteria bacterium]
MKLPDQATSEELEKFLSEHSEIKMMEILSPDVNGILRGKRIGKMEFATLFKDGLKQCASMPFVDSRGDMALEMGIGTRDGDPDVMSYAIENTLCAVPWLDSPIAQVFTSLCSFDGEPHFSDPRHVLRMTYEKLKELGFSSIVATEFEFYLLEAEDGPVPKPKLGSIPGTDLKQEGLQYSALEDLWENDAVLMEIHNNCKQQNIPVTTALSEFAPGQFEINLHHVDDPITACDQGVMLKRIIKGTTFKHGLGASFMAKPFMDYAGSGLHIHTSLYDNKGENVFADFKSDSTPAVSSTMRHAIGGLQRTMADAMAIFAPNANSYRRLQPYSFVPLSPNWGYNHRGVALRIPVCDKRNMRVEHRVASADANPYLVMACILAGIHYGITNKCEPTEMVAEGTMVDDQEITLPIRWEAALDRFKSSEILPTYLGEEFCRIFEIARRSECDQFQAQISNLDYEWYLRSV